MMNFPELKASQVTCTMAMAYAMALPGALDDAASAVGLKHQKDMAGSRVMLQLSKPKGEEPCIDCFGEGSTEWPHPTFTAARTPCRECCGTGQVTAWYTPKSHPEKFEKMYSYCKTDVEVERELYGRILKLSESEKKIWELDWKINQRGIQVDLPSVKAAIKLVELEKERLDKDMQTATDGNVVACSAIGQIKEWLKWQGVDASAGLAKADVKEFLEDPAIPAKVKKVLQLRQEAGKTSTAKLERMLAGACPDGRIRGTLQYHGAATGRWAGRRLQIQNFPRGRLSSEEIDGVFKLLGEA